MSPTDQQPASAPPQAEAPRGALPPGTYAELPPGLLPEELALYREAEPFLTVRHNDIHIPVSTQFALLMIEEEGADRDIVLPALMLHDLGWSEVPEELFATAYGPYSSDAELNRRHELASARLATEILERRGYPPTRVREIVRIIESHDSSRDASTLEEAVVKDADKFWRLCQLGFRINSDDFGGIPDQEVYDFIAVRARRWFLTPSGLRMALAELEDRRREYGFAPPPEGPPPVGDGIGDMAGTRGGSS